MDNRKYNTEIIRAPFEAAGIQVYRFDGVGGDNSSPHCPSLSVPNDIPVGSRGVRLLAEQKLRGGSAGMYAGANMGSRASATSAPMRIVSRHKRGRLLEWDCDTHELIASCDHGADTTVSQCIPTPTFTFTRIESAPGKDAMEADFCVYVWDTLTLQRRFALRGHQGRVTSMAASSQNPGVLVTAGLDYSMFIWEIDSNANTPQTRIDARRLGIISHVFIRGDFIVASASVVAVSVWHLEDGAFIASSPVDSQSAVTAFRVSDSGKDATRFSALTGTTDGFVREWQVDLQSFRAASPSAKADAQPREDSVSMLWQNKLHRANVEDVVVEEDICVSSSAFDGVALYNRSSGVKCSIMDEGGCRSLVVDEANKRVIMGTDKGVLCVLDYAAFAAGSSREVRKLWKCHPHRSAVTGLFLEVAHGNVWERILSCSADGEVSILDYTTTRTGKTRQLEADEQRWRSLTVLDEPSLLALPKEQSGEVNFISLDTMTAVRQAPALSLSAPVSAMRWISEVQKLLVATNDGNAFLYSRASLSDGEWAMEKQWVLPAKTFVSHFSSACDGLVTCCVDPKNSATDVSRMCLLNLSSEEIESTLEFMGASRLARSSRIVRGSPTRKDSFPAHFVLTQFDNRSIQLVHCYYRTAQARYSLGEGAVILPAPQSSSTFSAAFADDDVYESDYICSLDTSSALWRMTLFAVSHGTPTIRRGQWSAAGEASEITPLDLKSLAVKRGSAGIGVRLIGQGGIVAVFTDPNSTEVKLVDEQGSVMYVVQHNGSVSCTFLPEADNRTRAVSFLDTSSPLGEASRAVCTCVGFNPVGRYIVLGYRGGLVQLFDTSNKYVFARYWQPEREGQETPTSREDLVVRVQGQNSCVVAISQENVLTVHGLHKRVLLDRQSGLF